VRREVLTRREFLQRALLGLSALAIWRPSAADRTRTSEGPRPERQRPLPRLAHLPSSPPAAGRLAFSEHEFATVAAIAASIVPTDDDPGATEADVAGYIDRLVGANATKRAQYHEGLPWIDQASAKLFGRGQRFIDLSPAQQTELLQAAEATLEMRLRPVHSLWQRAWRKVQKTIDDVFGLGEEARFFRYVREDALAGFYTNPISWNILGYIGPPQPRGYPNYQDCPPQERR
jgi:hypothetical protein